MHDVGAIAAGLADRIGSLVAELLPRGRRDGHEWRIGSIEGEPGQSMAVHIGPSRPGVWRDFAGGVGGDALDLVAAVLFGGDKGGAVKWAIAWLGLESGRLPRAAARSEQHRLEAEAARARREAEAAEEARRKRGGARRLWLEGVPIAGTPAEAYLAARGIDLRAMGHAPGALRFHGDVWCAERGARHPAMLAGVIALDGSMIAIHRTFIAPADPHPASLRSPPSERPLSVAGGEGPWVKAPIAKPKKVLGSPRGGHIPLWKGVSDKTLREIPPLSDVYVSEGIEDGLSIALARPALRVIAGITMGNIAALELPPRIGRLVLIDQRDANPGTIAGKARMHAALRARGIDLALIRPPEGVKDFNDALCFDRNGISIEQARGAAA